MVPGKGWRGLKISKWFGRWETVCRCDQSQPWAANLQTLKHDKTPISSSSRDRDIEHNLIFDATANFCHSFQHKAPGRNFSLAIAIFQRETPLFMTHHAAVCPSNTDLDINTRCLDNALILATTPHNPPEALCRVLVGISCQFESDSVHWVKEDCGKKGCIYNTSIKMTPRGYLRCVLKQSQIWSRDGFVNTFSRGSRDQSEGNV